MEQFDLVYMTAANMQEAKNIANALLTERLVACVNIFDKITTIHHWEGDLKEQTEVAMIAKTSRPNISAIIDRVKELHSYKIPCVVSLPVSTGNQDFLNWVYEATV